MDILLRNFTEQQRAAMEKARGDTKLQAWGANALLDAAGFKGSRDNFTQKAPAKKAAAKEPAKKRVPVRPAAKVAAPAKAPAKPKSATKAKPASSKTDEAWRLEPQFRDKAKKKL